MLTAGVDIRGIGHPVTEPTKKRPETGVRPRLDLGFAHRMAEPADEPAS
jgi:hypothetical protein